MADRLTVPEVQPFVDRYLDDNANGGNLHVVLMDGNIDNSHIEWCLKQATDEGDINGAELAAMLLRLTKTQRRKIHG